MAERYENVLPPDFFREIEAHFPGKGAALIDEMLADRQHSRKMDNADAQNETQRLKLEEVREGRLGRALEQQAEIARRTQWFAFALAASGLLGSMMLALIGAARGWTGLIWLAGIIFSGTLVAIVLGFLNAGNGSDAKKGKKPDSDGQP
ncbi:MAG: hypothetical protein ACRC7C_16980 [Beijerinckiaceae bacterium]